MYDELIKRLRDWPKICTQYDGSVDQLHDEAADAIEELTDRNVGKWEKHNDDVVYWWQCSECECVTFYEDALTNFCPNCGSRMDLDGDTE